MENTLENKAKFFAVYFDQKVLANTTGAHYPLENVSIKWNWRHESFYLELIPLSSITDEDIICLSKIISKYCSGDCVIDRKKDSVDVEFTDSSLSICHNGYLDIFHKGDYVSSNATSTDTTDYLRSKGYALDFMGLSVEKLIEYGWVKLK